MEEINRAVIAISDLTVTNRDSIEDVKREAAHFLSEKSPEGL